MLSDLPLVSLLIFLPLLGVIFILLMEEPKVSIKESEIWRKFHRNAWSVGILISSATFLLALILLFYFNPEEEGFQFIEKSQLSGPLKMFYYVGLDGISLSFVLLTTFLMPLAFLASITAIKEKVRNYVVAFLVLETMMLGTFCSLDMIFFYIFFEGLLMPIFLIIGVWGGERRIYAAFKFFLYTFLGSVLMLVAMIIIAQEVGSTSIPLLQTYMFDPQLQTWLWLAFFTSFAIKVPMWPFHTWLPEAHVEAPTAGSVILAGILLKMGGYGFLRFSLPMFPEASQFFAPFIYTLSLIAVIYTSLIALVQTDMKKLIAYSSIAHMGIVTFGLFSFNIQGVTGAIFQMLSHGLVSGALFLCIGVVYERVHSREIARYGGIARVMPGYAVVFMIFTLASLGLPGTTGFVGEILVMMAAFEQGGFWALGLGIGMILAAAYGLLLYRRLMLERLEKEELKKLQDLTKTEQFIFVPLIFLIIGFGFYAKPVLNLMDKSVAVILKPFIQPLTLTDAGFDFVLGEE